MKTLIALLCLALSCVLPNAHAADANEIVGYWKVESNEAIIHIYARDGKYFGNIAWLRDPVYGTNEGQDWAGKPVVDRNNPDASQRNRPILGLEILSGLIFEDDEGWENGKIYNSDDGRVYQCKVWLADIKTLKFRGFIGIPLLGKTTTWTRTAMFTPP